MGRISGTQTRGPVLETGEMRVGMLNPAAMVWPSIAIASVVAALSLITDGLRKELSRYQ